VIELKTNFLSRTSTKEQVEKDFDWILVYDSDLREAIFNVCYDPDSIERSVASEKEETEMKKLAIIKKTSDKSSIHLHQDYTELAVICVIKEIVKEHKNSEFQQHEYFIYYLIVTGVQSLMIFCVVFDVLRNPNYHYYVVSNVLVFLRKICSYLHASLDYVPRYIQSVDVAKVCGEPSGAVHQALYCLLCDFAELVYRVVINLCKLMHDHVQVVYRVSHCACCGPPRDQPSASSVQRSPFQRQIDRKYLL